MSKSVEDTDPISPKQVFSDPETLQTRPKRKLYKPRLRLPKGLIEAFGRMPELRHNPRPDLPFDIGRSESANWLVGTAVADPAFRHAIHDVAYRAGLIAYDRERHVWKGCRNGTDSNG